MAASVKELNVLKWWCNSLIVGHNASLKKNLRHVLGWMIRKGS
jgi:hypothetical protein